MLRTNHVLSVGHVTFVHIEIYNSLYVQDDLLVHVYYYTQAHTIQSSYLSINWLSGSLGNLEKHVTNIMFSRYDNDIVTLHKLLCWNLLNQMLNRVGTP